MVFLLKDLKIELWEDPKPRRPCSDDVITKTICFFFLIFFNFLLIFVIFQLVCFFFINSNFFFEKNPFILWKQIMIFKSKKEISFT